MRATRLSAALAATLALSAVPALAATPAEATLAARLEALAERLARLEQRNQALEQRNAALEQRLAAQGAPAAPAPAAAVETRLTQLEQAQAASERALNTERLSESEPELVTRLKAVEFQALSMQKQTRQIEALEGITVSASLTSMLQHVGREGGADGAAASRLNYRGDVAVTLPGGSLGDSEGQIFTQLRFGQGDGLGLRPTFTATPNTTAFQVGGVADADSSFAILAQAWYQLSVPLPLGGFAPHAKRQLQLNAGKMDPFVFFDQNAIADDETTRFANNVFVHNPLLDSGGDVGADAYGFAPGLRVAYLDHSDPAAPWSVSAGLFGSAEAARFEGPLGGPLGLVQAEVAPRWGGLTGHWRLYAWHNGRTQALDGRPQAHAGWGLSVDQAVSDWARLFGRYGQRLAGHGAFDRALTLGAELRGDAWARAADAVGLAVAWLPASGDWRRANGAEGAERVAELYYRWRVHGQLEITPDLQWIGRPAADPGAEGFLVAGVRARLGF